LKRWFREARDAAAAVLDVAGILASFGLFYLGERVFHLSREIIQSLMYLKLSVAGHLTIFVTRTRGPFLVRATGAGFTCGGDRNPDCRHAYRRVRSSHGWGWALAVWGYALAWFLVNDRVKLAAYRVFDRSASYFLEEKKAMRDEQLLRTEVFLTVPSAITSHAPHTFASVQPFLSLPL
jgi:hypothetical protein